MSQNIIAFPTSSDPTSSQLCLAICTCSSLKLKAIAEAFKGRYKVTQYKDALHIDFAAQDPNVTRDVFCFSYGVTVLWGIPESEIEPFMKELKPFEINSQELSEREMMTFSFGPAPKIDEEEIILPDHDTVSRLAISHGLAQSVRLATFENIIQKTIDTTKHIPEQLAIQGKIPLSKGEIRKKMGELFIERASVNLHSDILDVPEFFWDHADVEPLYNMISNHLDLHTRLEVLNQRLDIVHELFEMLGNELNHQHSSRLEWIIIWLIVIEVIVTLSRDVFAWI